MLNWDLKYVRLKEQSMAFVLVSYRIRDSERCKDSKIVFDNCDNNGPSRNFKVCEVEAELNSGIGNCSSS